MMNYKIVILPIAIEDMTNIVYYISHILKNETAANKLAKNFKKQINNLSLFPNSNPEYILSENLRNKYRTLKVKNYIIFYTINEEEKIVTITRIIYKKRNFANFLN